MEKITEELNKELNQVIVTKVSIVNNCLDCPYRKYDRSMDGTYYICIHDNSPKCYEDEIYNVNKGFEKTPDWCPMGLT